MYTPSVAISLYILCSFGGDEEEEGLLAMVLRTASYNFRVSPLF